MARDQIQDGLQFRLGEGNSSIWYDDWSGMGNLALHVPYVHITDTTSTLRDVIRNGSWDLNLLYTEIPKVARIKLIQIQSTLVEDRRDEWIWSSVASGNYTVKEGYKWLLNRKNGEDQGRKLDWIWKLKVPEKIKLFVWRILWGGLQTNEKRFRCKLSHSPACSRCNAAVEDSMHCLRDCPNSRELWLRLGESSWRHFFTQNVEAWVWKLSQSARNVQFLAGLWGAWRWRNNMCLDAVPWTLDEAWRRLTHEHDDIRKHMDKTSGLEDQGWLHDRWLPPPRGFVKLNVDGSFREQTPDMGKGGVLRDEKGNWLMGFAGVDFGGNAFTAEATALRDGLKLAWEGGWRKIHCELDCGNLVRLLEQREEGNVFHLAQEIWNYMDRNWEIALFQIPRSCNSVANYLAKVEARIGQAKLRVIVVPSCELETLLLRDSLMIE